MGIDPQLAVLLQGEIVVGGQLARQVGVQGRTLLGRATRNWLGSQLAGDAALFEIAFDGGEGDLKLLLNESAGSASIHSVQDALAKVD